MIFSPEPGPVTPPCPAVWVILGSLLCQLSAFITARELSGIARHHNGPVAPAGAEGQASSPWMSWLCAGKAELLTPIEKGEGERRALSQVGLFHIDTGKPLNTLGPRALVRVLGSGVFISSSLRLIDLSRAVSAVPWRATGFREQLGAKLRRDA